MTSDVHEGTTCSFEVRWHGKHQQLACEDPSLSSLTSASLSLPTPLWVIHIHCGITALRPLTQA